MSNDWEKKYWERRQQQLLQKSEALPHYEPAHVTQDRQRALNNTNQWKEIDPFTAMYTNQAGLSSRDMGPKVQVVQIKEGATYYKKVEGAEFGNTMPLVRNCGQASGIGGREFEMKSETNCYCIDNLSVIDLGHINPERMLNLVEVRAPFIGSILVERNSIVQPSEKGPKILKG